MHMAKDCHDTALRYLEHRARSVFEIRSHLAAKGFGEEEIEAELRDLKELGYVSDAEYCREYIRYGAGKGRGPVRLRRELAEKGIDAGLIRQALEDGFDRQTEQEAAMREAGKLIKQGERPDDKTLAKIGRRLHALGYHTEVIYDVIGKVRRQG